MNLFFQPRIPDGHHYLDAEESRHCIRVLRNRAGDLIKLTDGAGSFYEAQLTDVSERQCGFSIRHKEEVLPRPFHIHIAVSPTKNADRIEWFVEKAVEFGIEEITLMACQHSERTFQKAERLQKVAITAMKQSLKARLPILHPITTFSDVLANAGDSQCFIAYVDNANPVHLFHAATPKEKYLVLIGPEGDFSQAELKACLDRGLSKVSLGESRLRTETAALAACHILNLVNSR